MDDTRLNDHEHDHDTENEHVVEDTPTDIHDVEQDAEEETISLVEQLAQVQTQADEYLESLKRERASFQNYKKRVEQERTEQQQRITGNVLLKLLPIVDDFDRAMDAVPQTERDEWYRGILLIQRKLEQFLTEQNISEIEATGQEFDPNFHEAVGVDTDTEADSGTVTQVLQRGYKQGERVLRPAMVRVAE